MVHHCYDKLSTPLYEREREREREAVGHVDRERQEVYTKAGSVYKGRKCIQRQGEHTLLWST